MDKETLTITDNRTNKTYTIPLDKGNIRTMDLRQIKKDAEDFGVMGVRPRVHEHGVVPEQNHVHRRRQRRFAVPRAIHRGTGGKEQFSRSGLSPSERRPAGRQQLNEWVDLVKHHTMIHETTKKFLEGFRYDAHPMAMLISTIAALSTVYPEARRIHDPKTRKLEIARLLGKMPTIAAYCYRHSLGFPYVYPDNDLSYTENLMNMLWRMVEPKYHANPIMARALDILFILHADHEQNCSANVMRSVGSSYADPYAATAAAAALCPVPLHGGANEEVLKMLDEIGSKENVPAYVAQVKAGHNKLMGFGAPDLQELRSPRPYHQVGGRPGIRGHGRKSEVGNSARVGARCPPDEYFITRKLYPNVDFYSGIIYQAMGFKPEMFTVLFAIPRTVGWLAQWQEMLEDPEQKIARPRQVYTGHGLRHFVPLENRTGQTAVSEV